MVHLPFARLNSSSIATLFTLGLLLPAASQANPLITPETVTIDDPNNSADSNGFGAVDHRFSIMKNEVTLAEYAAFLNAVAYLEDPSKPWIADLYDKDNMEDANDVLGAIMSRTGNGTPDSPYLYTVIGEPRRPAPWLTWFNAARFVNWLHNGAEKDSDTENGAYTLNRAIKTTIVYKNPNAEWWIPSENEWYKAAFYNPKTKKYSNYPTGSNILPRICEPKASRNNGINVANYNGCRPEKDKLTIVGLFTGTKSAYGLNDMAGNLWEWTDGVVNESNKIIRGGSWSWGTTSLHKSHRRDYVPQERDDDIGVRIARKG